MIALAPVRSGMLAVGSEEAIAEAGGVGLLAGTGAAAAAASLARAAALTGAGEECAELRVVEMEGSFRPGYWAASLAPLVDGEAAILLPASPDGRDLAPRLAFELGRPLLAGALRVDGNRVAVVRMQGRQLVELRPNGPFVATLLPGARSARVLSADDDAGDHDTGDRVGESLPLRPVIVELDAVPPEHPIADAELIEVLEADPVAVDLAGAERIVCAGAGLGAPAAVAGLALLAPRLGAALGATRVVTDAGWLGHDRQIGTTGMSVRPRCYIAFGVSGAAQHLGGLGAPRHVVSVNLDRSCPMTSMADLGLVTDASGLVEALARRLADGSSAEGGVASLQDTAGGGDR